MAVRAEPIRYDFQNDWQQRWVMSAARSRAKRQAILVSWIGDSPGSVVGTEVLAHADAEVEMGLIAKKLGGI